MRRRSVVGMVLLALALVALGIRAAGGVEISGVLSANQQEADEGYFAIAQDTTLVVKPGSPAHAWLKAHTGQRVTVKIDVDPASE